MKARLIFARTGILGETAFQDVKTLDIELPDWIDYERDHAFDFQLMGMERLASKKPCHTCNGTGNIVWTYTDFATKQERIQTKKCPTCKGTGEDTP